MEDFLATVLPRPADTVGHSGAVTQKSFLCTPNFVVLRKICFKHMINIRIFPPQKCILPIQTLKPGYKPGSDKIVSVLRIFCFEGHSASRCSITSKTFFYKSPLGGSLVKILGGGRIGLIQHWT